MNGETSRGEEIPSRNQDQTRASNKSCSASHRQPMRPVASGTHFTVGPTIGSQRSQWLVTREVILNCALVIVLIVKLCIYASSCKYPHQRSICKLRIQLSGDVQLNPGPRIYPCQICYKPVTWTTPGVACDDCDNWYHTECLNMPLEIYTGLENTSWHCFNCGMPQFTSSLMKSFQDKTSESSLNASYESEVSIGPPVASSSPLRVRHAPNLRA